MHEEPTHQPSERGFTLDAGARSHGRVRRPPKSAIREPDHRYSDRIDVRLLWDAQADRVLVAVENERDGESSAFEVDAAKALDGFRNPYAHASPDRNGALHREGVAFMPAPQVRQDQDRER